MVDVLAVVLNCVVRGLAGLAGVPIAGVPIGWVVGAESDSTVGAVDGFVGLCVSYYLLSHS